MRRVSSARSALTSTGGAGLSGSQPQSLQIRSQPTTMNPTPVKTLPLCMGELLDGDLVAGRQRGGLLLLSQDELDQRDEPLCEPGGRLVGGRVGRSVMR